MHVVNPVIVGVSLFFARPFGGSATTPPIEVWRFAGSFASAPSTRIRQGPIDALASDGFWHVCEGFVQPLHADATLITEFLRHRGPLLVDIVFSHPDV